MEKDYRFTQRKGRAIQVMFKGEYRWISTGCFTKPEAEAWAIAHLHTERKDLTLNEYAKDFFTQKDARGFRQRTEAHGHHYEEVYYSQRDAYMRNWVLPVHGKTLLKDITPRMVEKLIIDIPRTNSTKNKVLYAYSLVLQSAKDDLMIPNNPASDIKWFALDAESRQVFSEDELKLMFPDDEKALIRIWRNLWWASYFLCLHETGWRPSEIAALRKNNIYPEKKAIYTDSSVDWKTRQVKPRIKTTGKGFDYKIGFVSDQTMALLEKQPDEGGYIFCKGGKFISPDIANKHLRGVCERCKIPFRSQYSFRHTFDSELFGNVPDEFRKMLMGHSGKSNYDYLHLKPEEAIERAEKLKKSN